MTVLIVGFGSIAVKHTLALRQLVPDVKIFALRSTENSTGKDGIINLYDWNEVESTPDFILISNPTKFHREAIIKALSFSCPLFIEKPVLADVNDAKEIREKITGIYPVTYIACNLRFHPCIAFLKNYLVDKSINEVNVYCGSNLAMWRPNQDYTKSYSADVAKGGGVHLDLIHEIDYCYWLFGQPEGSVSIKRKVSLLKINSVDFAAYHLNYRHFTANIILNYFRKTSKRTIEIVSEEGEVMVDLLQCTIQYNGDIIFSDPAFKMEDTYRAQMDYFLHHISNGTKPMNSFAEALEVLKIATK
jgi:predicted dehydrogenase